MHISLETHPSLSYGIRFWAELGSIDGNIYSYPLYAAAVPLLNNNGYLREAMLSLLN